MTAQPDRAAALDYLLATLDGRPFHYDGDPADLITGLGWLALLQTRTATAAALGREDDLAGVGDGPVRDGLLALRLAVEVDDISEGT